MTDKRLEPKLPIKVPMLLWTEIAAATNAAFADSYLGGIYNSKTADSDAPELVNGTLKTRTNFAFDKLSQNFDAMRVLQGMGITLLSPNGRFATKPPERKRIAPEEMPAVRAMLAEIREAFDAKAAQDRKLFRAPRPIQARTGAGGISDELRERLARQRGDSFA